MSVSIYFSSFNAHQDRISTSCLVAISPDLNPLQTHIPWLSVEERVVGPWLSLPFLVSFGSLLSLLRCMIEKLCKFPYLSAIIFISKLSLPYFVLFDPFPSRSERETKKNPAEGPIFHHFVIIPFGKLRCLCRPSLHRFIRFHFPLSLSLLCFARFVHFLIAFQFNGARKWPLCISNDQIRENDRAHFFDPLIPIKPA